MSVQTVVAASRGESQGATHGGKCLTFSLGHEEFAVPILAVREIIGFMDITAVPQSPAHVRGVINLRGRVIPVVDLRVQFGMERSDRSEQTCIIVIETADSARKRLHGIVVDRVGEVLSIAGDDIEAPPTFGAQVDNSFITGMAKVGQSIKILLDIGRVLGGVADAATDAIPLEQAA